jgi:bleomycin hydrolase
MHGRTPLFIALACLLVAGLATPAEAQKTTTDGHFTLDRVLAHEGVTSQGRTGTCWSFATVSFLESEVTRITGKSIDLSELYPVFHTYRAKSALYVKSKGKSRFGQGGLSHDVIAMIRDHGMLPQSAYSGLCKGDRAHDHSQLEAVLKGTLDIINKKRRPGNKWAPLVDNILDAYISAPPATVKVNGRSMTPRQYADEVMKFPHADYVEVTSFSKMPMWDRAELVLPDNWMHDSAYINVPFGAILKTLDYAVDNGFSVAIDMDVSEKGFQARKGIATLTPEQRKAGPVTQAMRDAHFKDGRTNDDHLMHLIGRAHDKSGKVFYMVKNSWGKVGPYKGVLYISKDYMALKTLAIMVHKDGLAPVITKKMFPGS